MGLTMLDTSIFEANFTEQTRWGSLVLVEIVFFVVLFINFFPRLAKPFDQLFTLIHELGHAMAVQITGGTTKGIEVYFKPKGSYAETKGIKGGNDYLLNPAGYLAPTLFSAILIMLSALPYCAAFTLAIVGLVLIVSTLRFGLSAFTHLLGLGFGVLFIWVALKADLFWSMALLFLVAIQAAFTALAHLKELGDIVRKDTQRKSTDDATYMASLFKRWPVLGSPMFWVRLWTLFSFLILIVSIWFTWLRGVIV